MLRQGETEPQRVVANDLIAEVLDLAHSDLIQRSVTVTTRLDPSLPSVAADRVQLQQVLLNLIVNACDAMGDNAPTDRHIWIATANEGAAIRVSVSDCGAGISRHPVDSVFEPFITSKAHGLGLGLSICRSIVDGHGGRMWASNNEDRGATFTFLLPRTEVALEVPPVWRTPELMGTVR
jgi:C4-dicarboxylate-specific signal transduction histidine kinase